MPLPRRVIIAFTPDLVFIAEFSATPVGQIVVQTSWTNPPTQAQEKQARRQMVDTLAEMGINLELLTDEALGDGPDALAAMQAKARKLMAAGNQN